MTSIITREEEIEMLHKAITGTFMWSFKKGDNIVYNLEIIWQLYDAKQTAGTFGQLYNKPIMLLYAAIVECVLDDFTWRVRGRVNDTLQNISNKQIHDFKTKKRDKLDHYIAAAQKHNLFDQNNAFYDEMRFMKDARNRFHIQNSIGRLHQDEERIYTNFNLKRVERVYETSIKKMIEKFYRWDSPKVSPEDLPLPWSHHTSRV